MPTPVIPGPLKSVYENWHFAPATISNGFVFCSGIVGTSPDGEAPGTGGLSGADKTTKDDDAAIGALVAVRDPEAQFDTAFMALAEILAAAGCTLADLVEITTYHVDMSTHFAAFTRAKDKHIKTPYPAWTAIGVSELAVPGGLMEIRAVAEVPKG